MNQLSASCGDQCRFPIGNDGGALPFEEDPPQRATSGLLLSRATVTWKQVRVPAPVSTAVLDLRAILVTVDLCFPEPAESPRKLG